MRRWIPFGLWLAFVATVIVCADRGQAQSFLAWVNGFALGDKAGHVFLIGVMAGLLNHALGYRVCAIGTSRIQLGGLLVGLAITAEECTQYWFPARTFDIGDLLANLLGVLIAEAIVRFRPAAA